MNKFLTALLLSIATASSAEAQLNPMNGGDANGDGVVDIADSVHILSYLFSGGNPPVSVAAEIYVDPTSSMQDVDLARFVSNGDGTTTDTMLGLMWNDEFTSIPSPDGTLQGTTLAQAQAFVDDLNLTSSYSDWRLATYEEITATLPVVALGDRQSADQCESINRDFFSGSPLCPSILQASENPIAKFIELTHQLVLDLNTPLVSDINTTESYHGVANEFYSWDNCELAQDLNATYSFTRYTYAPSSTDFANWPLGRCSISRPYLQKTNNSGYYGVVRKAN